MRAAPTVLGSGCSVFPTLTGWAKFWHACGVKPGPELSRGQWLFIQRTIANEPGGCHCTPKNTVCKIGSPVTVNCNA